MNHEDDLPAASLVAPINIKVPPFWFASCIIVIMRELAGENFTYSALKFLFLQRLPQQSQAIFSISDQLLDQLARLADQFLEANTCNFATVEKLDDVSNYKFDKLTKKKLKNLV